MTRIGAITMTMRELDRLKIFQALTESNLTPGQAAKRLGLTTRRCNRPSNNRTPVDIANQALTIIRERYVDFGPTTVCSV